MLNFISLHIFMSNISLIFFASLNKVTLLPLTVPNPIIVNDNSMIQSKKVINANVFYLAHAEPNALYMPYVACKLF